MSSLYLNAYKLYPFNKFRIGILIPNSISQLGYIPTPLCEPYGSLGPDLSTTFCLWCSQSIVYWPYQGLEYLVWSDLTELNRRQLILNLAKDYHVQLKSAIVAGICRYVAILSHEFTVKLVYLF